MKSYVELGKMVGSPSLLLLGNTIANYKLGLNVTDYDFWGPCPFNNFQSPKTK